MNPIKAKSIDSDLVFQHMLVAQVICGKSSTRETAMPQTTTSRRAMTLLEDLALNREFTHIPSSKPKKKNRHLDTGRTTLLRYDHTGSRSSKITALAIELLIGAILIFLAITNQSPS